MKSIRWQCPACLAFNTLDCGCDEDKDEYIYPDVFMITGKYCLSCQKCKQVIPQEGAKKQC